MNDTTRQPMVRKFMRILPSSFAFAALATILAIPPALAADTAKAATAKPAQAAFPTPDALFDALAQAAKSNDHQALVDLLGKDGDRLVDSGDKVMDKQRAESFAASYAAKHAVKMEGDAKATLSVGNDDWPLPIPAVKGPRGWTLDTVAGAREILARRIGENELYTIQVIRAVVDAQYDYSSEDRDNDGLRGYASRFISTAGKHDGLYWPTKAGEPQSPLGPLVGEATAQGYKGGGKPMPYHGYYYRMLTAQGKDAQGGARNFVVKGRMLGGFAVVAYPATYGNSGIMTFITNQDGKVYEKDLGDRTAATAQAMKAFNPDTSWKEVK